MKRIRTFAPARPPDAFANGEGGHWAVALLRRNVGPRAGVAQVWETRALADCRDEIAGGSPASFAGDRTDAERPRRILQTVVRWPRRLSAAALGGRRRRPLAELRVADPRSRRRAFHSVRRVKPPRWPNWPAGTSPKFPLPRKPSPNEFGPLCPGNDTLVPTLRVGTRISRRSASQHRQAAMNVQLPVESAVREVLARFKDPETGRSITQLEQVHGLNSRGRSARSSPWA